jgi:flagellar FliL protein
LFRERGACASVAFSLPRRRPPVGASNRELGFLMAKAKKEADATAKPEADGDQPAKSKSKLPSKKIMIMALAGLLVVGGGGGGAYMFFVRSSHEAPKPEAAKPATFVDLPDVLVNLANSGSDRTQYLKVKIVLELPDPALVTQIQPLMPRVMDAFQTYLRELRPTDLDGSAGLYRLKEELTRRVNLAIAPNKISAVLFKEIVVQ